MHCNSSQNWTSQPSHDAIFFLYLQVLRHSALFGLWKSHCMCCHPSRLQICVSINPFNWYRVQHFQLFTTYGSMTSTVCWTSVGVWVQWTGVEHWTTRLDYWTGLLDWTTGLDYWTGLPELTTGLDYWTGLDYTCTPPTYLPQAYCTRTDHGCYIEIAWSTVAKSIHGFTKIINVMLFHHCSGNTSVREAATKVSSLKGTLHCKGTFVGGVFSPV